MRIRLPVVVLLSLLAAGPALAQSNTLGVASWTSARQASVLPLVWPPAAIAVPAPDTAALHRLFAKHRARRMRFALGTLAVGTALTIMPAVSAKRSSDPLDAGFNAFGAIAAGALTATLVPLELLHGNQYTRRRERRALADWQAHQLPAALRQSLKPKYFTAPK